MINNDIHAYIDESGGKGLLKNFAEEKDFEIFLLVALLIPVAREIEYCSHFIDIFETTKSVLPEGVSVHMREISKYLEKDFCAKIRQDIFSKIEMLKIPVVYEARRFRTARSTYNQRQEITTKTKAQLSSPSSIKVSNHSDNERIEEETMIGLGSKLDAYAIDYGYEKIHLFIDEIDESIKAIYEKALKTIKTVSKPVEISQKGFDPITKKIVTSFAKMQIIGLPSEDIDALHIGDLKVMGKNHQMIFAVDVVANALLHLLKELDDNAPLNEPESIEKWELKHLTYGPRIGAFEDII